MIGNGACADTGLFPIYGTAECEEAARQLMLSDTTAAVTAELERPEGCYWYADSELFTNVNAYSEGNGAEMSGPGEDETRLPICSSSEPASRLGTGTTSNLAVRPGHITLPVVLLAAAVTAAAHRR